MSSSPLPAGVASDGPPALSTRPLLDAGSPEDDTPSSVAPAEHLETLGGQSVPVPQDQDGINELRLEIDRLDAELVRLIQRRTAVSHAIGVARQSLGGPRIVYSREMAILERFRELGPEGTDLGMMLLAMGRGRLGRR